MKFRSALLTLSALGAAAAMMPVVASAQPVTGPYVSLGAGVVYTQDQSSHTTSGSLAGPIFRDDEIHHNIGPVGSAAVGYGLGNGLRIEIQGDFEATKLFNFGGPNKSNYLQQYHGFVNALYDFDLTPFGVVGLSPFVGVGGGYGGSHLTNLAQAGVNLAGEPNFLRSTGSDTNYAVQGIVGMAYNIAQVPGLALTAEYRFIATPDRSSYDGQYFEPNYVGRAKIHTEALYDHVGLVGLRYALFQPAPPPTPAPPVAAAPPAPEPARTYLVFFDWDRADLTTRARQIVAEAATASTHVQTTRIEVNGYTDLSGTAAYNQRLSVRRAQSVESELVRDGVARGEISIHGFGESKPLVPTAKGVREPQNRRVEIILH